MTKFFDRETIAMKFFRAEKFTKRNTYRKNENGRIG